MAVSGDAGLIGREVELAALHAVVDQAKAGGAGLVVVSGEAGIGKTRLVREVAATAAGDGFGVFEGADDEFAGEDAFSSLVSALGVHAEDDGAAPEPPASLLTATASQARARFIDGVTDAVHTEAAKGPTLLVLEDAHRIGTTAALALRSILRACSALPLLVLMTMRPTVAEESARAFQLLFDAGAELLELGPLGPEAIAALALSMLGGHPGPHLARLLSGAAGNPLYAIELLRGLRDDKAINVRDGIAETAEDVLPGSLQAQVMRELAGTSVDARGLLRLGAMLGGRFSVSDLAAVAGRTPADLVAPLDELLQSQLLREEDGGRLGFRHELMREVIYAQMPEAVRAGVHRQIADALAGASAPATRVAVHVVLGAEPGDEEAARWLYRAARETVGHDPAAAADFLASGAAIAPPSSPLRPALLSEQLDALMLAGRLGEAERVSADLVHQLREQDQIADAQRRRGMVLLLRNRPNEAADVLEGSGDGTHGCLALAEAAFAALAGADAARARDTAARARDLGRTSANPVAEALALCVLARLESFEFRLEESLALTRQAVVVADSDLSGEAHRYQPLMFEAVALHDLDRLDEAVEVATTARRLALQQGMAFAAPLHDGITAFAHLRAGRLQETVDVARAGIVAGEDTGMVLAAPWCNALLALASLHMDDIDTATRAVAAGQQAMTDGPPLLGYDLLVLADALVREELGDGAGALDILRTNWQLLEALPAHTMAAVLAPDLVRLSVAFGDVDEARPVVASLETAASSVPMPSWQGAALTARAQIDGDLDSALAAVEGSRSSPRPLLVASACEVAAVHLAVAGRTADVRRVLEDAVDIYEDAEARRDRGRALAALRAAGGKARRRQDSGDRRGGLSAAEEEVARLVAGGLSNPEIAERLFISRRTVETHLSRIFAKLGMSSRVELAVWAKAGEPPGD